MYLAVDIGGTKTLVATIGDDGVVQDSRRFKSNPDYKHFLRDLEENFNQLGAPGNLTGVGVGVPGRLDRENGIVHALGNLPWHEEHIQDDISKICKTQVVIENDANLAALSEAMLHKDSKSVLYFTISTGIGTGFIRNQHIDPALLKSEGGHILLPHKDRLMGWENFASGQAIYERLGKKAADITDQSDWYTIANDLALGFFEHIAILQPDLIIVGGSIGTHFDHYCKYLADELKRYEVPLVPIPPIMAAKRPEEAVLYGCYDLAKQRFGDGSAD